MSPRKFLAKSKNKQFKHTSSYFRSVKRYLSLNRVNDYSNVQQEISPVQVYNNFAIRLDDQEMSSVQVPQSLNLAIGQDVMPVKVSQHSLNFAMQLNPSTSAAVNDSVNEVINVADNISNSPEYSDPDSDSDENFSDEKSNVREDIREWAINSKISHKALNVLLNILRKFGVGNLPKDARTLLDTPREVKIVSMGPNRKGEFWYNGISKCLNEIVSSIPELMDNSTNIRLNFNMDGLPIYKSSRFEFWPILATIENYSHVPPMIVAIYFGQGKPELNEFLDQFVSELEDLMTNGVFIKDKKFHLGIRCFVCDAPARAFIKGKSSIDHSLIVQ